MKGNFLMHHLKFAEAASAFEEGIQHNPKEFAFAYYNMGVCFQKTAEYTRSIQYLKKAVMISPASP